jgi:hypothetical protein
MTYFQKISFSFMFLILILSCRENNTQQRLGKFPGEWVARTGVAGKNLWTIGTARLDPSDSTKFIVSPEGDELINTGEGSVDILTREKYGDIHVALEFMIPVDGNSGVYPLGEYEIQIWESFSKPIIMENQWLGTIVATAEPRVHAEKGGGEWQQLSFDFRAPRFDPKGNKIANARFDRVVLNGQIIHENVEVPKPTPVCLTGKESPTGPLMLQGFVGPAAFRNIKIVPLEAKHE